MAVQKHPLGRSPSLSQGPVGLPTEPLPGMVPGAGNTVSRGQTPEKSQNMLILLSFAAVHSFFSQHSLKPCGGPSSVRGVGDTWLPGSQGRGHMKNTTEWSAFSSLYLPASPSPKHIVGLNKQYLPWAVRQCGGHISGIWNPGTWFKLHLVHFCAV